MKYYLLEFQHRNYVVTRQLFDNEGVARRSAQKYAFKKMLGIINWHYVDNGPYYKNMGMNYWYGTFSNDNDYGVRVFELDVVTEVI